MSQLQFRINNYTFATDFFLFIISITIYKQQSKSIQNIYVNFSRYENFAEDWCIVCYFGNNSCVIKITEQLGYFQTKLLTGN